MEQWDFQTFAYVKEGDGAVILRCFSRDGKVAVPEQIDGLPVRELAPYAFSAHMDARMMADGIRDGRVRLFPYESDERTEACGDRLEELILPATLRRVGRYCFYNCGHLRRLEFPGDLIDWGSGVFNGCRHVKEICLNAEPDERTGLKQVLDELPEELTVEFILKNRKNLGRDLHTGSNRLEVNASEAHRPGSDSLDEGCTARLVFPEFYEEGVENTPARILETHVHGTGIRYRNCFQNRRFDFALYDTLFPYALAQENENLLTELVLARLRVPYRLEPAARANYENYIKSHLFLFGKHFLEKKDTEGLQWYLERFAGPKDSGKLLDDLSSFAVQRNDPLSQSLIMDFQRKNEPAPKRRKRLEL
ncbi:MAG: leucine-rich repeat domain-containing protein [Lachnospiraceae bacterium]|nr:leucine-rich repeat domain-containing protein [Lachnospiraceae bacterium]